MCFIHLPGMRYVYEIYVDILELNLLIISQVQLQKSKSLCVYSTPLPVWVRAKSVTVGWRSVDCRPKTRFYNTWNHGTPVDRLNTVKTERKLFPFLASIRNIGLSRSVCVTLPARSTACEYEYRQYNVSCRLYFEVHYFNTAAATWRNASDKHLVTV